MKINAEGGNAVMVEVPKALAGGANRHQYYKYAMRADGEACQTIRDALSKAVPQTATQEGVTVAQSSSSWRFPEYVPREEAREAEAEDDEDDDLVKQEVPENDVKTEEPVDYRAEALASCPSHVRSAMNLGPLSLGPTSRSIREEAAELASMDISAAEGSAYDPSSSWSESAPVPGAGSSDKTISPSEQRPATKPDKPLEHWLLQHLDQDARSAWTEGSLMSLILRADLSKELTRMLQLATNYQQQTSPADVANLLKCKHQGQGSCPTRTALRLKLQIYRTKDDEKPAKHNLVRRNPGYYEYTPGYVYVDWAMLFMKLSSA